MAIVGVEERIFKAEGMVHVQKGVTEDAVWGKGGKKDGADLASCVKVFVFYRFKSKMVP